MRLADLGLVTTCRRCGDRGIAEPGLPCPDLCPRCFDAALLVAGKRFKKWMRRGGLEAGIEKAHAALVTFGMRDDEALGLLSELMHEAVGA